MADRLLIALVIAAAVVLIAAIVRALVLYDRALTGHRNAQAPKAVCGADGPYGLECDREPHTEPLHKSQGVEWWPS